MRAYARDLKTMTDDELEQMHNGPQARAFKFEISLRGPGIAPMLCDDVWLVGFTFASLQEATDRAKQEFLREYAASIIVSDKMVWECDFGYAVVKGHRTRTPSFNKNPSWKQESPIDQFTAMWSALQGFVLNAAEGIKVEQSIERALELTEELEQLEPFLRNSTSVWL